MRQAAIVSAARTPIGRYAGALRDVRPDDMAALVIRTVLERVGLEPTEGKIDEVVFGAANQAGEDNRNVARMAALLAGLPVSVPGLTVNRLCGSGLDAVVYAARLIECGQADTCIAGGTESMTRSPYVFPKAATPFARTLELYDSTIGWRFTNPKLKDLGYPPQSMGETAENVVRKYKVSREEQDQFAYESQMKCKIATDACHFRDELVPVQIPQRKRDPIVVGCDEHPRPETTLEGLAKLRPAFVEGGTVTPGNSSGVNDGAAGMLLMERDLARAQGFPILAVVGPSATAGVDPGFMGLGPVPATQKLLERTKLSVTDFDTVEMHESFAVVGIVCIRELGLDPGKVNPYGGAIALGHPLGCTGARLVATLAHRMARSGAERGLISMCVGVGQGVSAILERPPA